MSSSKARNIAMVFQKLRAIRMRRSTATAGRPGDAKTPIIERELVANSRPCGDRTPRAPRRAPVSGAGGRYQQGRVLNDEPPLT